MRLIALTAALLAVTPTQRGAVDTQATGRATTVDASSQRTDPGLEDAGLDHRLPPAPWAAADPADSLYHAARAALADGDYHRAAELFRHITETYPKSTYVTTALYYQAFALYRSGGTSDLHEALQALAQLTPKVTGAPHSDAEALHTRICSTLARQGDQACTVLIDTQARGRGDDRGTEASCPSDESDIRIQALNGLLQMDAERAMPILRKVLERRDPCSVTLRRKALFLVSQKDPPASTDLLLSTARQDPDADVRAEAVFWLSQVHDPRVADMLDSIATHEGAEQVREKAVFALSQQDDARSNAALQSLAEREDLGEDLREKVVFWIGQSHRSESAKFLQDLFGRTTNVDLKEKILFSLSQHEGTAEWILNVALDDHQPVEVRKKALFWASEQGISIDRLVALYGRIGDPELRQEVLFAISQRHEPAAADALINIAKTDKDPELRKKAVFWLGQSSDPRAAQFLQEVISQ